MTVVLYTCSQMQEQKSQTKYLELQFENQQPEEAKEKGNAISYPNIPLSQSD